MADTMIIRRIEPLSCAKIAGIVYGVLGLIFGAMFALFSSLGLAFAPAHSHAVPPSPFAIMGVGAVIIFPVFYAILGFVSAFVFAWIYNLIASYIGGIEIDVA